MVHGVCCVLYGVWCMVYSVGFGVRTLEHEESRSERGSTRDSRLEREM